MMSAELDLDEAWGSETFSSSAAHIKEEVQSAASDAAASASEGASKAKRAAATPRQVMSQPCASKMPLHAVTSTFSQAVFC